MSLIKFNNEQKLIQGEIRKFATTELEPVADDIDKKGVFPKDIINNLFELGFMSLIIPEKYGGVDMDLTSLCIAVEELSKISASVGTIVAVNNCFAAYPLMKFGNENIKELYLTKLADGEIVGFICEPEIDLLPEQNVLNDQNNSFVFSGERDFVLNGETASFFILQISNQEVNKFYIINKDSKELSFTIPKMLGLNAAGIKSVKFNELLLRKESCLNSEVPGGKILQEVRDFSNICLSSISLGLAQASLDAATKYSKERKQFSRLICEFEMIQEMLSDIKIKIETARLLVYDAASKFDNNQNYSLSAAIARVYCGNMAVSSALNAIQIYGGYGYIKDYPVERYFRDAKVLQLLEASPRTIKIDIAREVLR
jgi:alkylation response protein AidB-like acyl-CoA dehydrogenase